jgi:acyl carrier protein
MNEFKDRLFTIFENVFDIEQSSLNLESSPETVQEWDSMKHMLLLMAIEEEFDFRFTDLEMAQCIKVGNILDILDNKV